MPTYTFKCEECEVLADLVCTMKEYDNNKDKVECPECKAIMGRDYSKVRPGVVWNCDLPSMGAGKY
jgi:putative FmdB family regulatory protein